MAKGRASTMEKASALIAAIEAEAYGRGKADARKELLEVLGGSKGGAMPARAGRGKRRAKAAPGRRTGGRKRAPRGSVRPFVDRVLRDHPDSTVTEIVGRAADDTERSIKQSSVRVELRNGRLQGRYVSDNGRWSHSGPEASAQAPAEAASPGSATESPPDTEQAAGAPPPEGGEAAGSETTSEGEARGTLGLNL